MIDTSQLNWLESRKNGQYGRYATASEESVWVCEDCGEEVDPYEDDHECILEDRVP